MRDNSTSQPADNYDKKITMTIPFYFNILEAILKIVYIQGLPNYTCGTWQPGEKEIKMNKEQAAEYQAFLDAFKADVTISEYTPK